MKPFITALRGLFTVEYALMASLLAIVTFASLQMLGEDAAGSLLRAF